MSYDIIIVYIKCTVSENLNTELSHNLFHCKQSQIMVPTILT